ncbi:MAG: uracil-DNA glycosylase [Thermoplasmata archaeon]|jgi:DNA polymerase|nr:uracil-DNA glycosylase [Thermoplasmata archaeon]
MPAPAHAPDLERLERIAGRVRVCLACPLAAGRIQAVPGEGDARLGVVLVGEAPGRNEDETGRPFCGAAGRNLDLGLAEAGLTRADVFVTSVVKCRPPGNRDPTTEEKELCRQHLLAQLEAIQPRVVVALGRHGLHGILGGDPAADFAKLAGTFLQTPAGLPLWVSWHPAAIIYRQKWKPDYLRHWREFGAWLRA